MTKQFTDTEIETIRRVLPLIDTVVEEAEYRAARRLVLATWRKSVIFIGSFVAALILLKDYLREALRWLLG